jgi:hypothetical protein
MRPYKLKQATGERLLLTSDYSRVSMSSRRQLPTYPTIVRQKSHVERCALGLSSQVEGYASHCPYPSASAKDLASTTALRTSRCWRQGSCALARRRIYLRDITSVIFMYKSHIRGERYSERAMKTLFKVRHSCVPPWL